MATLLIWAVAGMAVVGLILCILGFRGRRVGDHPVCRRCNFDLSGRPAADAGAPTPCPECGADLTVGKAIATGTHRRCPIIAAVGAVLFMVSGVVIAAHVTSPTALNAYKPISLLVWELEKGLWSSEADLATEFDRRRTMGTLSASDESLIIDAALSIQGDPMRRWPARLGDFIESSGNITAAQRQTYESQMVIWGTEVRPMVRRAGPIPIRLTMDDIRGGSKAIGSCMPVIGDLRVNGIPARGFAGRLASTHPSGVFTLPGVSFSVHNGNRSTSWIDTYVLIPEGVEPGPVRLSFKFAQHDSKAWHASRRTNTFPAVNWGPHREIDLVQSPEDRTVEIIKGENRSIEFGDFSQRISAGTGWSFLNLMIGQSPEGLDLAHSAWVRYPDGSESLLGYVTTGRGGSRLPPMFNASGTVSPQGPSTFRVGPRFSSGSGVRDVPLFPAGTRLILRPDPEFAEHLIDPVVLSTGELDAGEFSTSP